MIIDELRVVGSTQTNVVMAAEVTRVAHRALGARAQPLRKEGLGQLVYAFDPGLAWAAVTYLRTPTRVLWDVYRTRAPRLEPLYDELLADAAADGRALWRDGDGISVEARHVEAFAAGARQIVGTVKNALLAAAARRGARLHVDPARPAVRWVARLDDRGELVVSIDLGGGSLSHRGWRREAGAAPLREHLAAVLLMLCRFDPRRDALVDPMCGAGTLPIEALCAARAEPRPAPALAPLGLARPAAPLFPDADPLVIGCDVDLDVLAAARDNGRAAGVADRVTWQRCDIARLGPELVQRIARERGRPAAGAGGVIVANPPYGERMDAYDLDALYTALAATCRRFSGWRAGFLVGTPRFEEIVSARLGPPRIKKPLANASLRAYFYLYDL